MNEENSKLEAFVKHLKQYADERAKLYILTLKEKVALLVSSAAFFLLAGLFVIFTVFFLAFGVAERIDIYFNQQGAGFLIVGGFFLLVTALVFINRSRWIFTPFANIVLKNISDEED